MKRKKPSFNEAYHGYRTFSELLLDAQKESLVDLDVDARSRTYVVTRFGAEMSAPVPVSSSEVRKRRRRVRPKKRTLIVNDESAPRDAEEPRERPAPERDPHAERPRDDDIPF